LWTYNDPNTRPNLEAYLFGNEKSRCIKTEQKHVKNLYHAV